MEHFDDLAAFVAVVREGSFTRAAAQLGVTQSALSHTIRSLEKKLDIKLLNRTTRSLSATEAGERLYQTVAPRFADIQAELQSIRSLRGSPAGTVRISATEQAARRILWPKLRPLLSSYPDIQIEICSDNRFTDIVASRFDMGVRLGDDIDKDMIAVRISPDMGMSVVGSPAYFTRAKRPTTPQELLQHNCITMRLPTYGGLLNWEFAQKGKPLNVNVSGQLTFNDSLLILEAAQEGYGLAWLPTDMVASHLAEGRLESVLNDWAISYTGYHLYYPTRNTTKAMALVVEALRYKS